MNNTSLNFKENTGFTLIEMVVSVGIFALASTLILSSFLNILDVQKKVEASRVATDGFNFALETMMREIRTGTNYVVSGSDSSIFSFKSAGTIPKDMIYDMSGGAIRRSEDNGSTYLQLTPPSAVIEKLQFVLSPDEDLVTIIVGGYSGDQAKTKTYLNLQTTVSARNK